MVVVYNKFCVYNMFCHRVGETPGGFDNRLRENQEYLQDLKKLAMEEGVAQQVVFLPSCSTAQRNALLAACICVIYTPAVHALSPSQSLFVLAGFLRVML